MTWSVARLSCSRTFWARWWLRRVDVFLDGKRIKRTTRTRFSVRISVGGLRKIRGRHTIRVVATDRAGNRKTVKRSFTRCAAAIPRFTG